VEVRFVRMEIEGEVAVKVWQGQALTSIGVLVLIGRVFLRAVGGMSGISSFSFTRFIGEG
jgi:hypothetical protein